MKKTGPLKGFRREKTDNESMIKILGGMKSNGLKTASGTGKAEGQRLMVIHDLAGGYHEDAVAAGAFPVPENTRLPFNVGVGWGSMDVYVYFSHSRVSIPPRPLIQAAHTNGVQVLATVLWEWDGALEELSSDILDYGEESIEELEQVRLENGFDGYLINVEVHAGRAMAAALEQWVAKLSQVVPVVIWYDAITTEGTLLWQNGVNDLNLPFAKAANSGIMTNYAWKAGEPTRSAGAMISCNRPASHVWKGIDVWGRGSYGGGGVTGVVEGVKATLKSDSGVSLAVFAPGWAWESDEAPPNAEKELWKALGRHPARPSPAVQPGWTTTWNKGTGHRWRTRGEDVSLVPWIGFAVTSVQPAGTELTPEQSDSAWDGSDVLPVESSDWSLLHEFEEGGQAIELVSIVWRSSTPGEDCEWSVRLNGATVVDPRDCQGTVESFDEDGWSESIWRVAPSTVVTKVEVRGSVVLGALGFTSERPDDVVEDESLPLHSVSQEESGVVDLILKQPLARIPSHAWRAWIGTDIYVGSRWAGRIPALWTASQLQLEPGESLSDIRVTAISLL